MENITTKKLLYKAEYDKFDSIEELPNLNVADIRQILMNVNKGISHNEYVLSCCHEHEVKNYDISFRSVIEDTRKDLTLIYKTKTPEIEHRTRKILFFKINNDRQKVDVVSFFTKPRNNISEHRIYQIGPKYSDSTELINSFEITLQPNTEGLSEKDLASFYEKLKDSNEYDALDDNIKRHILSKLSGLYEHLGKRKKSYKMFEESSKISNKIRENYEREEVSEELKVTKGMELPSSLFKNLDQKIKPSKTTVSVTKSILYKKEYREIENLSEFTPEQIGEILINIQMIPHFLDYEEKEQSVNFRNIKEGSRKDLSFHYAHLIPILGDTPDERGFAQIIGQKITGQVTKVDNVSFFTNVKNGISEHRIYQIGARYGAKELTVNDLYGLGELNYDAELYDEAIKLFKRGLEIEKDDPDFLVHLGLCYVCKDEFSEAIRLYKKALEIDSEDAITWDNLGIAYEYLEDLENARKAYQKAFELEPEDNEIKEHFEQIKNKSKQG